MPPRTAKAKKTSETIETTKKGRGKAKQIEIEQELEDQDLDEKVTAPVEKKKRGKKAASDSGNENVESNGKDESAPPAKKGKKKVEESPVEEDIESIEINSAEDGSNNADNESVDTNDDGSVPPSSQGRKKAPKKETVKAEPKGRGKKAKPEPEVTEVVEEKPAGRGRGRKPAAKSEEVNGNEVEPTKAKGRGRKKPAPKATEKPAESDEAEEQEKDNDSEEVQKDVEEVEKKETKAKKGKKEAKAESEEKNDDAEEAPAKKKRVTKKEVKGKGDAKEEDDDVDIPEAKPKGRGRGKKPDDKAPEPKRKAPAKNKATTDYKSIDFTNESKNAQNKDWNFKISSWNVSGIRSWMEKGGLDYVGYEKPDILCLQETKCAEHKLPEELSNLAGYHGYWCSGERDGHSGVNVYTTRLAIHVQNGLNNEELDQEGRIITAEYEQFYLVCVYVPNSGRKLVTMPKRLQWNEEFRRHVKELDKKKPVIICGDMNVSHTEIDLANPKTNRKNAGFTDEERTGMTDLLGDGFVDTFRHLYPDKTGAYTFWTYMMNCRAKNVGWRLDYFIVSERLLPSLCDNAIRDQVFGSDHCPITLFLHLPGADKPKESL